jgi:hypothetical protein
MNWVQFWQKVLYVGVILSACGKAYRRVALGQKFDCSMEKIKNEECICGTDRGHFVFVDVWGAYVKREGPV